MEKRITACPYRNAPPEACCQFQSFFNGVCNAIDPNYEFVYDRMMTKGEEHCHCNIRRRDFLANGNKKVDHEDRSSDPISVLKMRFAKGEISKEEYVEMRRLLKE